MAVLFPTIGNAQAYQFRTPAPDVSAAAASWQMNSEPIVVGGISYYPTRGFRMFDGQVMVQTGMFAGVPVYSDATIEPYSELYVPLGASRMRVYERRRERELAGTTGSHLPTFPVDNASEPAPGERIVATDGAQVAVAAEGAVGTGGTMVPRAVSGRAVLASRTRARRTVMTPVASDATNGVWLEFNGARWYSNGSAESFSPDRFEPVGEYKGFPVYRDKISGSPDIWVAVVKDGPLAPYRKQ
jgi:hypothetical protein